MIMMPLLLRTLVIAAAHRTCRLLAPHKVAEGGQPVLQQR
jgi:hypothetical protein